MKFWDWEISGVVANQYHVLRSKIVINDLINYVLLLLLVLVASSLSQL